MLSGMDQRWLFALEEGADEGYDQEFDGYNIADDTYPTNWSNLSLDAGAVYRQRFGQGRIDWGGGGDVANIQAVGRTLPATATFDATAHLAGMTTADATYQMGLVLHNSANGRYIWFGMFLPDTTPALSGSAQNLPNFFPQFYVVYYADKDTSTTTLSGPYGPIFPFDWGHCYWRIQKVSDSSYTFYVSPDGSCWFTVASALDVQTSLGADPTHIGFGLNTTGAAHVACEWLRIRGLT